VKNPNDTTSKYYDIVSKTFKGEEVTSQEISLIKKLTKKKAKILDIGCGTGRHFLPLEKDGFVMTGIDESQGMLEILRKKKQKESRVINANFLDFDFYNVQFDAVLMFWNTFNEICIDDEKAKLIFKKVSSILKPSGVFIVNSDNPKNIDPEHFNFKTINEVEDLKILYSWEIESYDKRENLSNSVEEIKIELNGELIETIKTNIIQKWRTEEEYKKLSEKFEFDMESINLKSNDEMYLVFRKNK